jgi:hypothetical protein
MKRHSVSVVLVALVLLAGCGGTKRKPAVLTDPGARPGGAHPPATATPEPEQPVTEGPDIAAVPAGNPSGEDFSVNDASGENGPLADIRFDYDRAEISDEARATLEKHALGCRTTAGQGDGRRAQRRARHRRRQTSPSATWARGATTPPARVAGDRCIRSLGERP